MNPVIKRLLADKGMTPALYERMDTAFRHVYYSGEKFAIIRPCWMTRAKPGKYPIARNETAAIERLLGLLRVKFETGNDAPRGGQLGEWIMIKGSKANREALGHILAKGQ